VLTVYDVEGLIFLAVHKSLGMVGLMDRIVFELIASNEFSSEGFIGIFENISFW